MLCVLLAVIILFVALMCRLFYLQVIDGKELQIRATSQWLRDLPLASKRGDIVDCNNVVLASSITTYDVYIRARNVDNATELSRIVAEKLNLNFDKVYAKATNLLISESLIKMQVEENLALELVNCGYSGVYLSQNVGRVYPFGDLLTQILGYCSIDNSGQTGVENYYNSFLQGVDGKSLVQSNAQGLEIEDSLEYYIPSIPGANCQLTIDVQIQTILEIALKNAYETHKASGAWGIVLDAQNGDVLAMSNLPSFDLNNVPRDDLNKLNQLSKNSCVVDVYEPGSTFKIITMIAALNENLTNAEERFYCNGSCAVDGQKIKCWKTKGHGSQTLVEGFKNSCNCVFVNLAIRLGVERLYKYMKFFGIGQKTGIDISSESAGIVLKESSVKNVDLARIGFGQSVAVTPIQMARAFAGITTGKMVTPHVINKIYNEKSTIYEHQNKTQEISLSKEAIKTVNSMLFNNVNSEDVASFVAGYDIGGKTGTAQKFKNGAIAQGMYVSSFIGVYPTNQPKYIVVVCVDEPSNGAYYGGVVAKPVGQEIFSQLFKVKNISPDFENQTDIVADVEMPNVVGLPIAEALAKLASLGLTANVDGEGEMIIAQLPTEKTMLFSGDEVLIVTN
ncbi:MAG: PASTA domain-containing protein [Clostridia bacterium]|nr:PASTA domain-containing protein [Clostridia bacterium]